MLQTEYVRNLHCNYERLLLEQKPEDTRYQYCILNRGGIKGLLPCSLRYIDGLAYLYYDISSKQNIAQLFEGKVITREWLRDFVWSYRQIQQELDRFLLDEHNVVWYPEQVFLDLDNHTFSFLYIPYYDQENGFQSLVDFWVEHIDYEDETLVEFVYRVYDQLEKNGEIYLQGQIFEDARQLEQGAAEASELSGTAGLSGKAGFSGTAGAAETVGLSGKVGIAGTAGSSGAAEISGKCGPLEAPGDAETPCPSASEPQNLQIKGKGEPLSGVKEEKKKFFGIFEGKKRKNREVRDNYRLAMQEAMSGYAVAEETAYEREAGVEESQETDYGRTVYIEERPDPAALIHRLYSPQGKILASLDREAFSIGKKKEEVDLVLEDLSVSRMHARIIKQGADVYLEDLNSTNGTFKNGLRLEPYERRKLETGDEIKCGNVTLIFR